MATNKIFKRFTGSAWEEYKFAAYDSEKLGGVLPSGYALASHAHSIANITGLQTALDTKINLSDVLMPTNPFGGRKVYINHTDNAMYAADKKWIVTATRHLVSYGGNTYPMLNPDYVTEYTITGTGTTRTITNTPKPAEIVVFDNDTLRFLTTHYTYDSSTGLITFNYTPTGTIRVYPGNSIAQYLDSPVDYTYTEGQVANLFDGSYESNLPVSNGYYAKIRIQPTASGYSEFGGYPYGVLYLSYYYTGTPLKAEYRTYNYTYRPHVPGWKKADFTDFIGTSASASYIQSCYDGGNYGRTIMEIIVYGHDTAGGAYTTSVSQIDWKLDRPNLSTSGSTVTKYGANKLYYNLIVGTRSADSVIITPGGSISITGGLTSTAITNNGALGTRASALGSTPTHFLTFNGDPSSTTRTVQTRTPAQVLSDIGAYSPSTPPSLLSVYRGIATALDTTFTPGLYMVNSSTTGQPNASNYGWLHVEVNDNTNYNSSTNWLRQTLQQTDGKKYYRYKVNSAAWTSWYQEWNAQYNNIGTGATNYAAGNHSHGNLTSDGKIGSTADMVVVTGTNGALTVQSRSGIDSRSTFPAAAHAMTLHTATAWRTFFSNGSGALNELAFGAAGTYLRSGGASAAPTWATIQYSELGGTVPTWNQNTTGNAATATKLAAPVNINGVAFDGSAGITIYDGSKLPLSGGTLQDDLTLAKDGGTEVGSHGIVFQANTAGGDFLRELNIDKTGALTFNGTAVSLAGHSHAAGDITSGTVSTARLGSGTADNTTFLRGDNTWQNPIHANTVIGGTYPGVYAPSLGDILNYGAYGWQTNTIEELKTSYAFGFISPLLATISSNTTTTVGGLSNYSWLIVEIVAAGIRETKLIRYVAAQTVQISAYIAATWRYISLQTNSGTIVSTGISGTPTVYIYGVK